MNKPTVLITGGAGFIGANTATAFHQAGYHVIIVDNLSRSGVDLNLKLLKNSIPNLSFIKTNVKDTQAYQNELTSAQVIIHLAGQTAVTTSIKDPLADFDNNLVASINLLESIRVNNPQAITIFSSTNKVYGDLSHHKYTKNNQSKRYISDTSPDGIGENEPLSFSSPYGCSKGAADQYFLDYAKTYGLNTVVFRQSCIYGPFQQGVEDQGWVAHFTKQLLNHKPITIFGDGYQVRDLLYIDDLTQAYLNAIQLINHAKGKAINIGGGKNNAFSLLNVIIVIENNLGHKAKVDYQPTRLGDQQSFISSNKLAHKLLHWQPNTDFKTGLESLIAWQKQHIISKT